MPARLLLEQLPLLEPAFRRGPVLDLACGRGRNALAAARHGGRILALDRNPESLGQLQAMARAAGLPVQPVRTDLETGLGIPVRSGSCSVVLVFRFLFRPLADEISRVLQPGGVLIYETFTVHQRDLAHGPKNPAFLLESNELPELFPRLQVLHYEEAREDSPRPEAVARLVARKRPA